MLALVVERSGSFSEGGKERLLDAVWDTEEKISFFPMEEGGVG